MAFLASQGSAKMPCGLPRGASHFFGKKGNTITMGKFTALLKHKSCRILGFWDCTGWNFCYGLAVFNGAHRLSVRTPGFHPGKRSSTLLGRVFILLRPEATVRSGLRWASLPLSWAGSKDYGGQGAAQCDKFRCAKVIANYD